MKKYWSVLCALALALGLGGENVRAQTIKEEGRVAKTVWSGYWWPTARQEILQPLAKYDRLTGARSVEWEKTNNPPNVPGWVGLCHGWSAAAVMEDEPTRALRVGGINVGVGDQKAWLSLAHGDDVANFYGLRYDGPGDDPNDMAPELLWEALRTSIGEQKTAIVLDLEPGAEVWNYPVYAYRVEASKVRRNLYRGKIYVWLADDHVPADFVGVKRLVQAYPFEIQAASDGTPIHGTGRWIGAARKSHPDFAWVPYVVRSGNDELSYEKVCELLGRTPRGGEAPTNGNDGGSNDDPNENPNDDPNENDGSNADPDENSNDETNVDSDENSDENGETDENSNGEANAGTVAYSELDALMRFVKERGSDFDFDIRAEGLRREYAVGDELVLTGISAIDGYLRVVAVDPNGDLIPLYPQPGDDGRVEAGKEFRAPGENANYLLRCAPPIGDHTIRAFVSERPVDIFADTVAASGKDGSKQIVDFSALAVRRTPTEKGAPIPEKADFDAFNLGRSAYDEVVVYIGEETPEKIEKSDENETPEKSGNQFNLRDAALGAGL